MLNAPVTLTPRQDAITVWSESSAPPAVGSWTASNSWSKFLGSGDSRSNRSSVMSIGGAIGESDLAKDLSTYSLTLSESPVDGPWIRLFLGSGDLIGVWPFTTGIETRAKAGLAGGRFCWTGSAFDSKALLDVDAPWQSVKHRAHCHLDDSLSSYIYI